MSRETVWSTTMTLYYSIIRSSRLAKLTCRKCRATLDLHQPSVDRPHQFLATCPHCGAWFRLETRLGDARGIMVSLPEVSPLIPNEEAIPNQVV